MFKCCNWRYRRSVIEKDRLDNQKKARNMVVSFYHVKMHVPEKKSNKVSDCQMVASDGCIWYLQGVWRSNEDHQVFKATGCREEV
mmetsp:Transcript_7408/g.8624  ORF Transcript_7408/g.8624 Transcript_7408/m.8624 type:complete len:85 (+) Transcript_7408:67-321(+)